MAACANPVPTVATRWRSGVIDFGLNIAPLTARVKAARNGRGWESWNLIFEDTDGFPVFIHRVPLRIMTALTGQGGEIEALEIKASLSLSHYDYKRIASVNVGWAGWDE